MQSWKVYPRSADDPAPALRKPPTGPGIRRIRIDQLEPGMYVHDLNCRWIDRPVLKNRFPVEDEAQILQIRALGIRDLYIDTTRGADVPAAPTIAEVRRALDHELLQLAVPPPAVERVVTRDQEWNRARQIQREAQVIVRALMIEARQGQLETVAPLVPAAEALVASVRRNQDALLGLSRMRHQDRYPYEHPVNVAVLLIAFGQALELPPATLRDLGQGGLLHDLGRATIPDAIQNKPGRLTAAEFAIMREHVAQGVRILRTLPDLPPIALAVAAEHHERIDGSGYPAHKQGDEISRHGQMAAIADVYDALTANRVHCRGQPPYHALRRLLEWSRHHFDPALVQGFIRCLGVYPVGTLVLLDSGRLGVVVASNRNAALLPVVRVVLDTRQRRYLTPEDLDLSARGAGDRIAGVEPPERWRINPEDFLAQRH